MEGSGSDHSPRELLSGSTFASNVSDSWHAHLGFDFYAAGNILDPDTPLPPSAAQTVSSA